MTVLFVPFFLFSLSTSTYLKAEDQNLQKATFAAGCFWGVEKLFWDIDGVVSTQVGYLGGTYPKPSYEDICTGHTGHAEAVEIVYDPAKTDYETLLEVFWKSHNPTTLNQQGNDHGTQYRSAIFYHSAEQKQLAEKTKKALEDAKVYPRPIVTEIAKASEFYSAESYHQKYLKKNPNGYCSLPAPSEKVSKALRAAKV